MLVFEETILGFGNKCKYDFLKCFLDVVVIVKYSDLFGMHACLDSDDGNCGKWI